MASASKLLTLSSSSSSSSLPKKNLLLKFMAPATKATPSPPIGPLLGQRGIKAQDFCLSFNLQSQPYLPNTPLRVHMTVYPDRSYTYHLYLPTSMWFLKQHLQVLKGSAKPGHDWLLDSPVSLKCIYELALLKQKEQPYLSLQSVCKMLVATARSAGLVVVP